MIAAVASYEVSDPTVDSQVVTLKASGADTIFTAATPKFAAQAIRKIHDIGWRPLHMLSGTASSIASVLNPAGPERSIGAVSAGYLKSDVTDWAHDPAFMEFMAFMRKYYPEGDIDNQSTVYGYSAAMMFAEVLRRCGDKLTRENLLHHATSIRGFVHPILLPGITVDTSPTDFFPIEQMQMRRFDGKRWVGFSEILGKQSAVK